MAVNPTYPGVYIQEVPSGVRTIAGVSTSVAAFIGFFPRGTFKEAKRVFNRGDFDREFGGIHQNSEASYSIGQFFLNGGGESWVVRTAKGDSVKSATIKVKDGDGNASIEISAASPGDWGNRLLVDVNYGTEDPDETFNLRATELTGSGKIARTEIHRNLSMERGAANDVEQVIKGASKLIRVKRASNAAKRPAQCGTVSKMLTDVSGISATKTMKAEISVEKTVAKLDQQVTGLRSLASLLQMRIRAADDSLANVTVNAVGTLAKGAFLQVKAGVDDPTQVIKLSGSLAGDSAGALKFGTAGPQYYALGATIKGNDGDPPEADDLKTALRALDKVDLFNILSIPDTVRLKESGAAAVSAAATAYCEKRRAFYILDVPHPTANPIDTVEEMERWLDSNSTLRHENVSTYFPRPQVSDPLQGGRLRAIAPSGSIAGLFARVDANRGVWKAPAGIEAGLRGVQGMDYKLTDDENGALNPLGVNCLRNFRLVGNVCWGARTLDGADQLASEWKYIPVRRLALFIEESLYRGLKWVVFEPNDEPLWAQIRLNVGAFMHDLYRQGAFQGQKPSDAYFVKCDTETTTQSDRNRGMVNIWVGFAPLKPAEFVVLYLQQMAGQIEV